MSNRICFVPTKFENLRTGIITYGFRAYEGYDQVYDNTLESVPDDDFEFLKIVVSNRLANQHIDDMLDYMVEYEKGCEIDGTWYDWNEIRHIVKYGY